LSPIDPFCLGGKNLRLIHSCLLLVIGVLLLPLASAEEPLIVGHWPLRENERETAAGLATTMHGIEFRTGQSERQEAPRFFARFNGRDSVVEGADAKTLRLGTGEFSIALWLNTETELDDALGDLVSQYDSATRTGFHLGLYNHGGVTNGQPNSRQLHFGIDQGRIEEHFKDHGRPGTAVYIFSLCVHNGHLYAATCHSGKEEAGHVYRYAGKAGWTDLGSPDKANAISALAVHEGALYAASSKYRLGGSALAESENPYFGGKVFRLGADDRWVSCGTLSPETEGVGSLLVFRGKLYAGSLYRPAGFFRYEGGEKWTSLPTPEGKRVEAMTVFNGAIFATSYDEGSVFRFDGKAWETVGKIPGATQTYGFAIHGGSLYVSEWPQAHVFRYAGGTDWIDAGKLGQELEAMPLLVYNGKMYGGTLPSAEVYRYDGEMNWAKIGQVDTTPNVKYRRAWSMAVFQGRLFVGTLPAGKVVSIEAGRNATWDRELKAGWHHVAAVRENDRLRLYVDGEQVAQSAEFAAKDYDLTNRQPLRIGFGAQDHFRGDMADVRLYRGALSADAVRKLSQVRESNPGK
jgi:Concanavalin A-like lectin/glucanases superfamily